MQAIMFQFVFASVFCIAMQSRVSGQDDSEIDFGRQIGPILSDTCFKCHGPDEHDRKADLRLDTQAGLFEASGAVVPNDPDASELYQRIISDDADLLMPPTDSGRKLNEDQKQLFKRWIEQGARWENHWSLIPPKNPPLPKAGSIDTTGADQKLNAVDRFVAARLAEEGLSFSKPANRATLIRRVAFDLTGLPPSPAMAKKYQDAKAANWYENLVDELLALDSYGEHMARYWLDAARYGDTHGLHLDNYREMWPYRDWVINAINENKSYREFTIEQLAGDLLENPTEDQLIASGFNRAHITTNEGGAIVEEVYVRNVVDRVSTTGTVFMGLTVGCAQCHDHKFDPISQKEFYQLFAFFNNMTDAIMDKNAKDPEPILRVTTPSQKIELAKLELAANDVRQLLDDAVAKYEYVDPAASNSENVDLDTGDNKLKEFVWVQDDSLPAGAKKEQPWNYGNADQAPVRNGQRSRKMKSKDSMVQHFFTGATPPLHVIKGDTLFAFVYLDPKDPPKQVMLQFNDGDWNHRVYWGQNKIGWGTDKSPSRFYAGELPKTGEWIRLEINAEKVGFKKLSKVNGMAFTQFAGTAYWDSAGIVSSLDQAANFKSFTKWLAMLRKTKGDGLPGPIKAIAKKVAAKVTKKGLSHEMSG